MKALVLCAGLGTRLGELTRDTPKPLLPIGGEPLIAHTLRYLAGHGFDRVAINLYYRAALICDYVGTGKRFGVEVTYSPEERLLGTAGAVKQLAGFWQSEREFLVIYGDLLVDEDLSAMLRLHQARHASVTLLLHRRVGSNSVVRMDDDGRITAFVERPTDERHRAVPDAWVNSGVQILSPSLLDAIPDDQPSDLPRDVYVPLLGRVAMFGHPLRGYRCAIDSAARYAEAQEAFATGRYRVPRAPGVRAMTERREGGGRWGPARAARRWVLPAAGAAASLYAFHTVGETFAHGWLLDLGSLILPAPGEMMFFLFWAVFGSLAVGLLAVALTRVYLDCDAVRTRVDRISSPSANLRFLVAASLLGFVVPALVRLLVLRDAPLSDDESPYRFMAELLAAGRLQAPSPPLKLFYDRPFMVNDGRLYAQYFVGWPALMAPGIWLGIGGYMNAVYSAMTVPPLFLTARRLVGSGWARLMVGVYLTAPMLMIGAATEMSHTSCLFALAWMGWFLLRSRDRGAPAWSHAGVAAAFGVAFFIRPSSALGAGLPILICWLWGLRRLSSARRLAAMAAFVAPALTLAALFLAVNQAQTGSALKPAYVREAEYARENQYRFTNWSVRSGYVETTPVVHFDFTRSWTDHVAYTGLALLRFNFALFGWPSSLLFMLLAPAGNAGGVLIASFVTFCLVHLAVLNPGLDTFGPHHYFELAGPVLVLSALGLARAARWLGQLSIRTAAYPAAVTVALILASVLQYTPIRLGAIAAIAAHVNRARDTLAAAGIRQAVVFTPQPFPVRAAGCSWPRHFVGWRPHTDPDLANDVLWVNHISVEENRKLMQTLPGRRGYVLQWDVACRPRLLPLDGLTPEAVPEAPQARPRQIERP